MSNRSVFSRRELLTLIGAVSTNAFFSNESEAQSELILKLRNPPLNYCKRHFKQQPDYIITKDNIRFDRKGETRYETDDGNVIIIDRNKNLKLCFEIEENQWYNEIKGTPWNTNPGIGDNPEYDYHTFEVVFGHGRMGTLNEDVKKRSKEVYESIEHEHRKWICDSYGYTYKRFFSDLPNDSKTDFKRFVNAYFYAINHADNSNNFSPNVDIFKEYDDNIFNCYDKTYPWLCLALPTVPDRAIIFNHEVMSHKNGSRIDWEYVRKHGE